MYFRLLFALLWVTFKLSAVTISAKDALPSPDASKLIFNLSSNIFPQKDLGSYTHEKLLSCQPAIQGAYEFSGHNELTLYPSEPLKANQRYSCQLNKTSYTPQGKAAALFTTQELYAVIERFGKMVSLKFNTAVDPKKLKAALTISRTQNLAATALAYALTSNQKSKHFIAMIQEDVLDDELEVLIDTSLSVGMSQRIVEKLSSKKTKQVTFDPKRKSMTITGQPRFVATDDGKLAIRLYLPHYFYSSTPIRPFISIQGIENFDVSSPNYLYGTERNQYGIPNDNQRYVDITAEFESGKSYDITILKGLKSEYSYQLRHDQTFTVTMGDRKQYIAFESDKPYLSSSGEVGLKSVNTEKATIIVEHLMDQNYRYFVTFKGGDGSYLSSMSQEVGRKSFHLGGKKNTFGNYKINIKPFMKDFKSGVYQLTIHYDKGKTATKAVYFSDIGITAKVANDQLFVWSTKLSDSSPIDDAHVKIYSAKNELIQESMTDDDGVTIVNLKKIAHKDPRSIVVSTDDEQSFLYLDTALNSVYTPISASQAEKYKTFIYLQSKLVRPGNDAQILMLLKDKNYLAGSQLPLDVKITDPSGYKVFDKVLKTSEHGAVDFKLFVEESFKTGTYRIAVKLGKHTIGNGSFSVENFIPQKIKNSIDFKQKAVKPNELLHATVSSRYLFGAPASKLKAEARLTAVSKVYTHRDYKGFNFNNEIMAKKNVQNYLLHSKSLHLDSKGKAELIFDTHIAQNPPSMLQAQLGLTVFDDGRGVSTYKKIDIFPYESMVGLKLADASIEKGDAIKAHTVALEPQEGSKLSRKLEVVIKKSSWEYYYDAQGYYRWNKRYHDFSRFYINSGDPIEVTMPNSGDYTLVVADRLSGHSTSRDFRVSGWDYTPIDPTSDMGKVQVTIDKTKLKEGFKQGDTLQADIKSPLQKGHLLLTLEAQNILWHKVIKLDKGSASVKINLDFPMPEGAYLRTHMVRSTATPSTLLPFRASSATFIKSDKRAYKQTVGIKAAQTSTSHTTQKIEVTAKPNSSVIVSVVDEGILQIKGQLPPQPFNFFERMMKEQIALFDLYDKVMHYQTQGKLLSFGGDGSARMKRQRKHLGPKTGAKRVKPFVYWSKIVTADSNGKATVQLPIPAFNGQAEIVAVAFDTNSVGSASQSIVVKDDIIIKPTFTRFIHIQDKLQVPIRIFNTTKTEQRVTLSATASKTLGFTFKNKEITIKANSSELIEATLQGLAFGKGDLKIYASTQEGKRFQTAVQLPVTSAYALQTKVYKGETSQALTLDVDAQYFGDTVPKLYMNISDSYLSQLLGSVNALIGYPHGCAEQTSSKLLGMLYIDKFVKGANDQHTRDLLNDRKRFIQEGIYKLASMQKISGEFGYWRSSGYINPYASIYASDIILELKKQNFDVPADMLHKTFKALRNQSRGYGNYRYGSVSHFERLYAAYLLAMHNQLDIATANSLYDQKIYQRSLVSHYMMAAILKKLGLTAPLNAVFAEIEGVHYSTLSSRRELGGSFYSKVRDLSFALYLHVTHFKKNDLSKRLLEEVHNESKDAYSTQDQAFIMRAMAAYYKDQTSQNMKVEVVLNHKAVKAEKPFTMETELTASKIFITPKQGVVNYTFEVSNYIKRALRDQPLQRQMSTLKLYRSYVDEGGLEVDPQSLNIGDLFYSKIEIASKKKLKNIVISNRIPACFEIVNERLQNHKRSNSVKNSLNFKPDYQNFLDDKVLTFINLSQPSRYYDNKMRTYQIRSNTQIFYQPMRVLAKGSCQMPAAVAEAMYDSRINAYSKHFETLLIHDNDKRQNSVKPNKLLQKW